MVDISSSAPGFISRGFFLGHRYMLNFTRSGSIADAIAAARDVPSTVIPYAASTALNRVASAGRRDIQETMTRVFDRPNKWTINSPRVFSAKKDRLVASVYVKDDAPNNGTRPEDYLLPNVVGGPRKEKRFERNMRYAGILARGHFAVLGQGAKLDQYGNLSKGQIQKILTATKSNFDPAQNRTKSARSRKNARTAQFFVGGLPTVSIVGGEMVKTASRIKTPGIYERVGRGIRPVLIFTSKRPNYRKRLDFDQIVEARAKQDFAAEFERAATDILNRRRR